MAFDDIVLEENFMDGICDTCGNTGLAGERCRECGAMMVSTGDGIDKYEIPKNEEDDKYPEDILKGDPDDDALPLEEVDKETLIEEKF